MHCNTFPAFLTVSICTAFYVCTTAPSVCRMNKTDMYGILTITCLCTACNFDILAASAPTSKLRSKSADPNVRRSRTDLQKTIGKVFFFFFLMLDYIYISRRTLILENQNRNTYHTKPKNKNKNKKIHKIN